MNFWIYPTNRLHMTKLLKYTSHVELYSECQDIIEETLKKLKIEYVQPEGAFYLFPKIPEGIDEMEFSKLMIQNFFVVLPGSAFGAEGYDRLSFCKKPEDIKRGMEQFEKAYIKVIEELGNQTHIKAEKEV